MQSPLKGGFRRLEREKNTAFSPLSPTFFKLSVDVKYSLNKLRYKSVILKIVPCRKILLFFQSDFSTNFMRRHCFQSQNKISCQISFQSLFQVGNIEKLRKIQGGGKMHIENNSNHSDSPPPIFLKHYKENISSYK